MATKGHTNAAAEQRRVARWLVCPICECSYDGVSRVGRRCGDLSHGQQRPCVGRLMPVADYRRAEWYRSEGEYSNAS